MPSGGSFFAHIIFATKAWQPVITGSLMTEIIDRLKRNFKIKDSELLLAQGKEEHLHILGRFTDKAPFSEIVGWSKGECSHWVHEKHPGSEFYWQKGFWYEVVTEDELEKVRSYILDQENVHKKTTFSEEITRFRKEIEH